jgi:hypothetical protein
LCAYLLDNFLHRMSCIPNGQQQFRVKIILSHTLYSLWHFTIRVNYRNAYVLTKWRGITWRFMWWSALSTTPIQLAYFLPTDYRLHDQPFVCRVVSLHFHCNGKYGLVILIHLLDTSEGLLLANQRLIRHAFFHDINEPIQQFQPCCSSSHYLRHSKVPSIDTTSSGWIWAVGYPLERSRPQRVLESWD